MSTVDSALVSLSRSRLCVKNLPKYVAEDRLKEFFSRLGEITDSKLMRTKDGKSRQFAFIGFKTEQEAEQALNYFNNSYMDTSKITCEIARKVGDPNTPPPWSRYSIKKQEEMNGKNKKIADATKKEPKKSKRSTEINDPQLQEFLEVMLPRKKSKLWSNDTLGNSILEKSGKAIGNDFESRNTNMKQSVASSVDLDENDERENGLSGSPGAKKHSGNLVSDMDFFKNKVKKDWSDSDSESDRDDGLVSESEREVVDGDDPHDLHTRDPVEGNVEDEVPSKGLDGEVIDSRKASSPVENDKEQVIETRRLFVRNLPYTATEDDLSELFSKFGSVSEVHIVVDKDTKRSKGYAYVLYSLQESGSRALEELDNSIFQGRLLHVMPAKEKFSPEKQESIAANQVPKSFKQQKEDQRKASEARGDTRAWNSLFMRTDTVVENMARKYGVNKRELFDRETDSLAVDIALGETQVIAETKKALLNGGVNIAALEECASGIIDASKRSNHVVLVKNLPYGSSEGDLARMFGKFGSLEKIILPPTKTLALVIFLEAAEARAAFKGLAYKRYKDAPLYLEWAPSNILSPSYTPKSTDAQNDVTAGGNKRVVLGQHVEEISEMDIDPDRVEMSVELSLIGDCLLQSRSLFVKNLNFKTTDEGLKEHFNKHVRQGSIRNVTVKKHLKNKKNLSMGFGFVEFDSAETVINVCRDLQGTILDGHALILQLCHAKKDEQVLKKVDKDRSSTKLIVRNVAFEATAKDLRQLFSPFGQIKSLRLPMKFGTHRGFAFVEFVTKQETQNALQALSSTHLYGRHLVLERAKEGETLEELRARTAAHFIDEQNDSSNPTKLSKKRKHDVNEEEY
ncbi:hypothetical protein GIB67_016080 [Kingdonia uniflora]|uniref:RRM domain-containing protein n=1 Tax=Kingdonia uniflora TaxID=39325 RepID=A0A7J7L257_9MAGN|nr:hypothetical protein GIB67_016080 [Kingdonia uniflora]